MMNRLLFNLFIIVIDSTHRTMDLVNFSTAIVDQCDIHLRQYFGESKKD